MPPDVYYPRKSPKTFRHLLRGRIEDLATMNAGIEMVPDWVKPAIPHARFEIHEPETAMLRVSLFDLLPPPGTSSIIWTDGSRNTEGHVGAAMAQRDTDRHWETKKWNLGTARVAFDAELFAIAEALRTASEHLKVETSTILRIITDFQNALRRIQSDELGPGLHVTEDIRVYHQKLEVKGIKTYFHWAPGYHGILGNEIADKAA